MSIICIVILTAFNFYLYCTFFIFTENVPIYWAFYLYAFTVPVHSELRPKVQNSRFWLIGAMTYSPWRTRTVYGGNFRFWNFRKGPWNCIRHLTVIRKIVIFYHEVKIFRDIRVTLSIGVAPIFLTWKWKSFNSRHCFTRASALFSSSKNRVR